MSTENTVRYTKKQLLGMGFSVLAIKGLNPVEFVKAMKDGKPSRGRPAGLYSQAQVDELNSGKPSVTVEAVAEEKSETAAEEEPEDTDPAPAQGGTTPAGDLTKEDFAQAA